MAQDHIIETEVLVIGGGIAGGIAAIRAKEQGRDVLIVDKAYAGKSGASISTEPDLSLDFAAHAGRTPLYSDLDSMPEQQRQIMSARFPTSPIFGKVQLAGGSATGYGNVGTGGIWVTDIYVPKKWWPNLSKPYAERYPKRFPGESVEEAV